MNNYVEIKKDRQITKFNYYGFFKNLKFFEPYLIVFLMGMNYNLFQIGMLYSIREAITYVFEVPSGILADHFGKKKVLLLCFVFYSFSFMLFFWSPNYQILIIAMMFFGLGEAFRSGAHKALIMSYLEFKGWFEHKGFVYGRSRSYSLIGSSISAFASIVMILNLPSLKWIFLISIIPYIIDFALVYSYPDYIDQRTSKVVDVKSFYKESKSSIKGIATDGVLKRVILSSASFDGVFKTLKDYVQPALGTLILAVSISGASSFSENDRLTIYLGVLYGVFYILSSIASRNVYRLSSKYSAASIFDKMYDLMGISLILLGLALAFERVILVVVVYLALYMMKDARKPVFVDFSGNFMKKDQRATVLSIESQIRALIMVVLAPALGWVADSFSMEIMFLGVGVVILISNRLLHAKKNVDGKD